MILLIDNYDSFTYNLHQILLNHDEVKIIRNDKISIEEIRQLKPNLIVLSPGPGKPQDAGLCVDIIKAFSGEFPILGICLGHQAIAVAFGANVVNAPEIRHGKTSQVFHNQKGIFQKSLLPFIAGRYHSLIVEKSSLPSVLKVHAEDNQGNIMCIAHELHPTVGLQFHPESILTPKGSELISQFILQEACYEYDYQ